MTRGARPTNLHALWVTLLAVAIMAPGLAGAATSPAGRWAGEIDSPDGTKVRIFLVLEPKDGVWSGSLEDPMLGTAALSAVKVTDTSVGFQFQPKGAPFAAEFSGSYVAADDRVSGTFSMQSSSRFVKFSRVSGGGAPATLATAATDTTPVQIVRIRHAYKLAVTGRMAWWASLHSVRDETYSMNNLTAAAPAFDGAVKYFLLDGFSVYLRGVRGGQNVTDDASMLAAYAENGLTADSYLSLDGIELGVAGYLGNKLMPRSKFNPYISGGFGRFQWAMTTAGRGTDSVTIEQEPVEGADLAGWFGLGTEYELNSSMALDFEWAWRFFLTEDTTLWRNSEDVWGNTMTWALSAGLTYGF